MSPLAALEPERTAACVSDYAFDRWLAGALQAEERAAAEAHVASCARCERRLAQLEGERVAWHAAPLAPLTRQPAPSRVAPVRKRAALYAAASSALALAAAALLFLRPAPRAPEGGTRAKGPRSIGFYVKHGAAVRRGAHGEVVAPGDALRFTYSSERRGYLAVLSFDGARRASVYYPSDAAHTVPIEPGRDVPLPISTVLDGVLGQETLLGVFCETAVALEPLRRALEADPRAPPPPGCTIDRLAIEKRSQR